jgi:O-antigen ligase
MVGKLIFGRYSKVMNTIDRSAFHTILATIALCGLLCGMVLSRVLLSVSMIVLVANALVSPRRIEYFNFFISEKALWLPVLAFVQVLISLLFTSDLNNGMQWLLIKLPFLLLPFGFCSLIHVKKNYINRVLSFFVLVISASSIYVLIHYYLDKESVNYWQGDVMYTPYSHIRYSLIVCMAIFTSVYIFINEVSKFRYVFIVMALWLLVFLHFLAVRSGLVAFYLATLFLTVYYIVKHKKWIEGISFLGGLILLPALAFLLVPTFQQKLDYVQYDIKQFIATGDASNLSDGQRLFSLQMGWQVFKENPLFGVGAGDMIAEMNRKYEHHQNIEPSKRLPHNQWLWTAVSGGLLGVLLLMGALILPIWFLRKKWNAYFIAFLWVAHSSMLTEATLESQIGVALYLIFYLLSVIMILQPDAD